MTCFKCLDFDSSNTIYESLSTPDCGGAILLEVPVDTSGLVSVKSSGIVFSSNTFKLNMAEFGGAICFQMSDPNSYMIGSLQSNMFLTNIVSNRGGAIYYNCDNPLCEN